MFFSPPHLIGTVSGHPSRHVPRLKMEFPSGRERSFHIWPGLQNCVLLEVIWDSFSDPKCQLCWQRASARAVLGFLPLPCLPSVAPSWLKHLPCSSRMPTCCALDATRHPEEASFAAFSKSFGIHFVFQHRIGEAHSFNISSKSI